MFGVALALLGAFPKKRAITAFAATRSGVLEAVTHICLTTRATHLRLKFPEFNN